MLAGIHKSRITFPYAALKGWEWPVVDIVGERPGPRLAVIAGVHVNETSSIDATIRLQRTISPSSLRGRISIMPIVNLPAVSKWSQYVCPLDGKNINFSFPGRADGTFAEAMACAILNDWAADADVLVDLHGGDLCEEVAHFMVLQCTGDREFDEKAVAHARCFDAELIVKLDPSNMHKPARSCSGRALRGQHAAFAEAGRIGLIEEESVLYHYEGVLRLAGLMGMLDDTPPLRRAPVIANQYIWVPAPTSAVYRYRVEAGQKVEKGMMLAKAENTYGESIGGVVAPADGYILWTLTHALVEEGNFIMGLAVPE